MVKENKEIKRSGEFSFELSGKYRTEIISSEMIPVDMNKTYTLSSWMRSLDKKFPASAYMGLYMYDKNKTSITTKNVLAYPKTATVLAKAALKGAKKLWVDKNPKCLKHKYSAIAFKVKENYEDLPNFDVSSQTDKILKKEEMYEFLLKKPLKKSYPVGTHVRLHSPWRMPFYSAASGWIPAKWKKFSVTIKGEAQKGIPENKFRKGTKYVRVFVWFGNWNRKPKKKARLLVDDIKFTSDNE